MEQFSITIYRNTHRKAVGILAVILVTLFVTHQGLADSQATYRLAYRVCI